MAGKKKKQKRPRKDGTFAAPKAGARKPSPWLTPRRVLWVSAALAVLTPAALIGLAVLATNPDYGPLGVIVAVLVLIAALAAVMMLRVSGWFLWPALLLGIVLIALPGQVFKYEVMEHRGVRTEVVITAQHSHHKKEGGLSWTCAVRRTDGKPLPHAKLGGPGCDESSRPGTTDTVLIDPDGWVPPIEDTYDYTGLGLGAWAVALVATLWALLVAAAARHRLRLGGS